MNNPLSASKIRVGCCGFQKAQRVYYENFKLIEIQNTFYKLPQLKTGIRWRAQAPADFTFTMKALQLITHEPYIRTYLRSGLDIPRKDYHLYGSFRPTPEVFSAWERTYEFANILRCPVVVFQCPPQFRPKKENLQNMRVFFHQVKRGKLLFAWEPRGDWPLDLIRGLCGELDLIHCVDAFQAISVTGSPAYFRMHGSPDYTYQFTDGDLVQLKELCAQNTETYCLFNNVYMWEDAQRFQSMQEAS